MQKKKSKGMLEIENSCLVVIDVQGKLAQLMFDKETLFKNIQVLIKSAKILNIPILWAQQVPKALGETIPQVAELLDNYEPINKAAFSCWGEKNFRERLNELNCSDILICGIEAHVCVYQTAIDLFNDGKRVTLITDAVSSRTLENKQIAINELGRRGVNLSSVEMLLFELLKTAEHPEFRQITKLIK